MRLTRRAVAAVLLTLVASTGLAACAGDEPAGLPAGADWSPAPVRVGGLSVLATSDADGFALRTASGEKTFLPGINLGSTVPLRQPGEVAVLEAGDYRRWFEQMAGLGIRVVRVYTIHPPAFYDELARHNEAHPDAPLYLVQGVYLPDESYHEPGASLFDPAIDDSFSAELADASAAVHGDLERAPQAGRASGTWTTDVGEWVAAWVVGVEWEPTGVLQTDADPDAAAYEPGRFFRATPQASGTERWLATHLDELAAAEAARGTSVPIAFVNWPTTDPLEHPTEPLAQEDLVGVDATHVLPTTAWPGGTFASFHAYPYYPDFMRDEPGLDRARWRGEPDRYAGYLASLRDHFAAEMPLMVTEYGVPSSLGSAHHGTNGRDQGNHSEQTATAMDADMMHLIADQGLAGAFVFSWTDEWFKRTWNTMEQQVGERRQLWHDPLTNEQWFGMVATDPEPVVDAAAELAPGSGPFEYVHVWADASWVHLDLTFRDEVPEELRVEADVVPGPQDADYRVLLEPSADRARLEVRRGLDPIRLSTDERPYHPEQDRPWHLYRIITNRAQPGPGQPRPAEFLDVGLLRRGSWDPASEDHDSLSTWQVDEERDTVRVRLPWSMLGMADPSSRTALGEGTPAALVPVEGIDLTLTADGVGDELAFTWPEWNHTGWSERLKDGAGVLEEAFRELAP